MTDNPLEQLVKMAMQGEPILTVQGGEATEHEPPSGNPPETEPEGVCLAKNCHNMAIGWGWFRAFGEWDWGPACGEHETSSDKQSYETFNADIDDEQEE